VVQGYATLFLTPGKHTMDDVGIELADADAAREQIWNTPPAVAPTGNPTATWPVNCAWTCAMKSATHCSTPP
jgi:hypothetical protein